MPHLSTGDMLRKAMAEKTPTGMLAAEYLSDGQLVPDKVVVDVVTERMAQADCDQGCLLDGFPRTLTQAEALDDYLKLHDMKIDAVLLLDVATVELKRRMLERAKIEGRSDDTPETIERRMRIYHRETQPLADFYRRYNLLIPIDGSGTTEEVFHRILQAVDTIAE